MMERFIFSPASADQTWLHRDQGIIIPDLSPSFFSETLFSTINSSIAVEEKCLNKHCLQLILVVTILSP